MTADDPKSVVRQTVGELIFDEPDLIFPDLVDGLSMQPSRMLRKGGRHHRA
jgi:hypothetical protein